MCISAWITAKYNAHHNFPNSGVRARVRYLLFLSIWTLLFGSGFLVIFLVSATSAFASVASHFFLYVLVCIPPSSKTIHSFFFSFFFFLLTSGFNVTSLSVTWILWLAAAAAITQTLGGALNCNTQSYLVYCGQLNALEGFAWLIWCVTFICFNHYRRSSLTVHAGCC